ncbi:MAG: HDOD domain-containing protein [Pseudomonadota bacterium]
MSTIKELIKEIHMLKPIPQIASQILSIIEDPSCSIADIADIVLYDPSTTANLLKICNSAYFGQYREIDSVRDAISFLGIDQMVDLILLHGGAENLTKSQEGYGLHEGELWRQAVASALIAKDLSEKKGISRQKHIIFTAALLKDIGKVILDRFVSDSFEKISFQVEKKGLSFREAEKKVIGVDHAELGGLVAKIWKFSPKMIFIISNHHMSDQKAHEDIETSIVYLADTICMMMGIGGGSDGLAYRFHQDILDKLGVNPSDLQEIIMRFGENMQKVEELIQAV